MVVVMVVMVVVIMVVVVVITVVVMGGAHMTLLVRIPNWAKPTITGTGLTDMGTGMALGTKKSICTRIRGTHTRIPTGYIRTRVQH